MARLPDRFDGGEVADRIRLRRGGMLAELDTMLLHAPEVADGWNAMMGAVRSQTHLAAHLRELAILRVAALNRADYEWRAHEPLGREAGLTDQQLAALRLTPPDSRAALPAAHRAVRDYTDAMTLRVEVEDHEFARVHEYLGDRCTAELTVIIAAYNMVSRFLVALRVGEPEPITDGAVS